ncbi:hypothetical protein [Cognatiluteimonas telluris]|jgi:hypothetical protein|uniref:hypothetical protein n=1 Tax=Cognatiluteimonas telluris TaxID=1104775 RepID=UPI001407B1AA|nr:hypothetical protein [Lysobacter telluris]
MLRVLFTTALILGTAAVLQLPVVAQAGLPHLSTGQAAIAPQSHAEGRQAVDDATAASLIGAITSQLGSRTITVRLGPLDVEPAGLSQRDISGRGQLRIDDDRAWIPFRFRALYDMRKATTGATQLVLGDDRPALLLARDSPLAGRFHTALSQRLQGEFSQQHVGITLDAVHSAPVGGHYLAVHARGRAVFGSDGQAGTEVHALYDTHSGQWLQLEYRLGDEANGDAIDEAVALR